jgi:flagella basal body P-ring formation protein FlgA
MTLRISMMLGVSLLALLVFGLPQVAVSDGAGTMKSLAEMVRASVESFVRDRVTMPADSVAVTVDLPTFTVRPHEVADLSIDLFSSKPVVGTVPVKVVLLLNAGDQLTYAATARVRVFASVVVATERLDRHDIITGGALRAETREVTHLTDGYFTAPAEIEGKRVRRVITAGAVLRASDVEAIPLVGRGAGVTVAVVLGRVTVTSKATALEDGEIGEIIRVQDHTTGKRLLATVAGKGLVVLDESML